MRSERQSKGRYTRGILLPEHAPRATLRKQSSFVCTNDFMGVLHPREQNFHPAKCYTIFNSLIFGSTLPEQIERTWKRSLVCTDTCKMSLEYAPGAKPLVCIGLNANLFTGVNTHLHTPKWGWTHHVPYTKWFFIEEGTETRKAVSFYVCLGLMLNSIKSNHFLPANLCSWVFSWVESRSYHLAIFFP